MQTFTITRSDYAQAYRRATANMRAVARHREQARLQAAARKPWLHAAALYAKVGAWLLVFGMAFLFFQAHDPGPRAMSYGLCAAISAGAAFLLVYVIGVVTTRRQLHDQLSDDGTILSPQSVVVSEAHIEQYAKGAYARLDWSLFQTRQEDDALYFLFYEPSLCMLVPKAVLSPQEQALIEQRIPLLVP